jgi:hypothetical protein
MPKEHAGGLQHSGLASIPVEWREDKPFAVQIVNFNFESLDSIEDQAREALRIGRLQEWLDKYVIHQTEEVRREAIDHVVSEAISTKNPGFRLVCMGFAAGVASVIERTMESWAVRFGVSKQDVQQGIDAIHEKYALRKSTTERDMDARLKMRLSNYRPKEQVPQ